MNILLYEMLKDIECDSEGKPTLEVIMSARDIAGNDSDTQRELDEIEEKIVCDDED